MDSIFAGKGSTKIDEGNFKRIWHDPHVIYVQGKREEISLHSTDAINSADAGAGQWVGLAAWLLLNPQKVKAEAWVVGFSTDRNKYLEVSETYLPWSGLPSQAELYIEMLNNWQKTGSGMKSELSKVDERASGQERPEIKSVLAAIRPDIESRVSNQAGRLLDGGEEAWQIASEQYRPLMKAVAASLAPGITTNATRRRKRIADILPRMTRQPAQTPKPTKSKRGEK
jgi:hypothetical protein